MKRVAIIGSGPAGLFCAYTLAGLAYVTIYEAGLPIEQRTCPETGCDKCAICHILEGGGGAGGLSDGKNTYSLMRGTQMENIFPEDAKRWLPTVDGVMVHFAGEGVWYNPMPAPEIFKDSPLNFETYPLRHVGSDGIRKFVKGITTDLERMGVEISYLRSASPRINLSTMEAKGVVTDVEYYPADVTVIAAGLQGIPWIEHLMMSIGSPLGSGPAGFGLRLETDAEILAPLHKQFYDYKISHEMPDGVIIRSFCCNQNGYVINERHTDLNIINVNGHSFLDPSMRSRSSNVAIMAKIPESLYISPQDFVIGLGKELSKDGSQCQSLMEFMDMGRSDIDIQFLTNPQSVLGDIASQIHVFLLDAFRTFIWELNRIVSVISPKSIIYAPEIKYYGRRVNVTPEWRCKDVKSLYIIGSGSGYLDSFVATALSGIIAAENIKREVL